MKTFAVLIMAAVIVLFFTALNTPVAVAGELETTLTGKICKGTFSTGTGGANTQGAMHIKFYQRGDQFMVGFKGSNSPEAYQNPTADIPGEEQAVSQLSTAGTSVKFVSQKGTYYHLDYLDGRFEGIANPANDPTRRNWKPARVQLSCSNQTAQNE